MNLGGERLAIYGRIGFYLYLRAVGRAVYVGVQ